MPFGELSSPRFSPYCLATTHTPRRVLAPGVLPRRAAREARDEHQPSFHCAEKHAVIIAIPSIACVHSRREVSHSRSEVSVPTTLLDHLCVIGISFDHAARAADHLGAMAYARRLVWVDRTYRDASYEKVTCACWKVTYARLKG